MAINKKLIHFKKKEDFEKEVAKENILDTSIVFIKDSKEIHTHEETYKTVTWKKLEKDPYNKHDYVDMGEAGIWAICNVGASKPEEAGLYFAWGETIGYSNASQGKLFSENDYKMVNGDWYEKNISKYNRTDNLITLELEDDAARVIMGGSWRIPTQNEFIKLDSLCNNEWVTNYKGTGVKGMIFKLKTDESKQLFFPAAGFYSDGSLELIDESGPCWTSSIDHSDVVNAMYIQLDENGVNLFDSFFSRYTGMPIRGFIPKQS